MFGPYLTHMVEWIVYVKRIFFHLNNPYFTVKELCCLRVFLFEKTDGKVIMSVDSNTVYDLTAYIYRNDDYQYYHLGLEKGIIISDQKSFNFSDEAKDDVMLLRDFYTENPGYVKEIIKRDFDFARENTINFPLLTMSLYDYNYLKKILNFFLGTSYTITDPFFCIKKNGEILFQPTEKDTLNELKKLIYSNSEKESDFFKKNMTK